MDTGITETIELQNAMARALRPILQKIEKSGYRYTTEEDLCIVAHNCLHVLFRHLASKGEE